MAKRIISSTAGYMAVAQAACNKLNKLEDKLALEIYSKPYNKLTEDERTEITYMAYDEFNE